MNAAVSGTPLRNDLSTSDRMIRRTAPSLRSNAVWTAVGNGLYALGQWGVVIVLARLGDAAAVGTFALAAAITAPIVLCANCALRTVQATDVERQFAFGDYLAFRGFSTLAAAVAILAAAGFVDGPTARQATLLVGLGKVVESFSDLLHGLLWQRERLDRIGQSQAIRGLAVPAAGAIALACGAGVVGAAAAIALAYTAVLALFDVPAAAQGGASGRAESERAGPRFDAGRLRRLFVQVWPMGVTVLLGSYILNVPRYAVEHYLGIETLGVFAALAYLAMVGNLAATTAAQVALPRQSRAFAAGDRRGFVGLTGALIACGAIVGALLTAAAFAVGPMVLSLVYGAAYADHGAVLATSVAAVGFGAVVCFLDHALYAARRFRVQLPINFATALVTTVVAYWSTREFGLLGAAGAACVSMAAAAALRLPIVWASVRSMEAARTQVDQAVSEPTV
jgi:O-antigen/teichoic acid export membrane protein